MIIVHGLRGRRRSLVIDLALAFGLLLGLCLTAAHATAQTPRRRPPPTIPPNAAGVGIVMKRIDPCAHFTEEQLRPLVAAGIGAAFPIAQDGVTLSNPELRVLTCPGGLRVEVRNDIRVRLSGDLGSITRRGRMRFGSPAELRVMFTALTASAPVTTATLVSARACLSDIQVLSVDLQGVPSWLDNAWLRGRLNRALNPENCTIDLTAQVAAYLAAGHTL